MPQNRLISLDVFRGMTIILMTVVNNPGDWGHVYPPLLHAEWHGWTPTDLVFPFFIFIMGVSLPFANPVQGLNNASLEKILARSLRIICLGLTLNFFSKIHVGSLEGIPLMLIRLGIMIVLSYLLMAEFKTRTKLIIALVLFTVMMVLAFGGFEDYREVRLPGVLQRIGVVYFFSAIIYLTFRLSWQAGIALALLVFYWILMTKIPVPGFGEPNLDKGTNLSAWLDNLLLEGHMYVVSKTWDPEGVLSTLPAIASGILGGIAGQILKNQPSERKKLQMLLITGTCLLAAGLLWNKTFPINKPLWTSSYVLFVSGLAIGLLTLLYYLVEVLQLKKWTTFFVIWGVNPMIVFFYSGVIPRVLGMIRFPQPGESDHITNLQEYIYRNGIARFFEGPENASLAGALVYVLIWTFILWIFFRNKLIFKV